MKRFIPHILTLLLLVVAFYISAQSDIVASLKEYMDIAGIGPLAYVVLLAAAVVIAPITVLPLIPLASTLFGPFLTSIYSVLGWTIGAMLAFLVARYLGKPVLSYLCSLKNIERYERLIGDQAEFLGLVLLRMVIPVEVLSYAVGLFSSMRFIPYTVATFIGVIPFSFIFAYGGSAITSQRYTLLIALMALTALIFLAVYYFYIRKQLHGIH